MHPAFEATRINDQNQSYKIWLKNEEFQEHGPIWNDPSFIPSNVLKIYLDELYFSWKNYYNNVILAHTNKSIFRFDFTFTASKKSNEKKYSSNIEKINAFFHRNNYNDYCNDIKINLNLDHPEIDLTLDFLDRFKHLFDMIFSHSKYNNLTFNFGAYDHENNYLFFEK
jgi:hypothetical protein